MSVDTSYAHMQAHMTIVSADTCAHALQAWVFECKVCLCGVCVPVRIPVGTHVHIAHMCENVCVYTFPTLAPAQAWPPSALSLVWTWWWGSDCARGRPGSGLACPALPRPAEGPRPGVGGRGRCTLCCEACAAGRPPGRGPCCPPHPAAALDRWPLSFRSGPSCSSRRSVGGHGVARLCAGLARACRAWAAGSRDC